MLLPAAPSTATAQSLGPTGYWQYNGTGTVTNASLTTSGTNATNVLTLGGVAPTYTASGMVGSGIEMSYASLPTVQSQVEYLVMNVNFGGAAAPAGGYALGGSFTMSTWYYVTNVSTGARTSIWEGANDFDISFGNGASGNTTATAYNTTSQTLSVPNALTTGTWHHLLQVYNSVSGTTQMTVYLDGAAIGTTAGVASTTMSGTGIHIGTARTTAVRPLYGLVDETAVWANQALTAAQAVDVYNRGLAGVYLTNTNAVRGYLTGTNSNAWLTGANWGGTAPGVTATVSSTNGDIAVVGAFAFTGGLGIDMATASGNLALGAISFNSLQGTGGNLSIGNSAVASGTLTLNGAQIDGFSNVILSNEGLGNLTITNVQGSDSGQRMTLQLGGTANSIRAAAGRTLTIATDVAERTAGSGLSIDGGGLVVFSGSSSRVGPTTVAGGTLAGAAAGALGFGTASVATGATLRLDSTDALRNATLAVSSTMGTVSFAVPGTNTYAVAALSATGSLNAGGNTLAIGGDGRSATFAGTVTAATLQKTGTGVLALTGSGGQTATVVSGGAILAGSPAAFGTGTVTLAGGGLQLSPTVSLSNDIVLESSAATTMIGGLSRVDYLVVAGGGGGGNDNAGGGGGGGVLSGGTTVNLTSYLVTVGTGGAGGSTTVRGGNGGNSTIFGLTAIGGGGGASGDGATSATASMGGSGGGGQGETSGRQTGAAGTAGQGFAGGNGGGVGDFGGGGGGGAGGVGGNATGTTGTNGGVGGIGLQSFISGSGVYYGGGGGGGSSNGNTFVASGGLGGGGAGRINNGDSGTNGLGGGGGGSGFGTSANGGGGGSGVVIVRYLGDAIATGGSVTAGTGSSAGYTIHAFTTTGSGTLAFTAMDATLSGRISGTGGFTWNSTGRLTLSGSNAFSGGLVVGSGTLQAANANALGTGVVTLGNGAVLVGTGTFSTGGLVFGTTTGNTSTVAMTVSGGAPATGFTVGGDILANGGSNSVTFAFGSDLNTIATGTYTLATYAGSLSGLNAFTWSGSKGGRQSVAFTDVGSALNLVIGNAFPIWTGSNGTGWSTTDNWKLNDDNVPTSFLPSDTVLFTDGADTGTVVLSTTVAPLTTTVNANALDYVFQDGGGRITAGSLAKSGSATLTITGSNSYAGGTTLSAGTLRVRNNSALGSGTLGISGGRLATDGVSSPVLGNATTFAADVPLGSPGDTTNLTLAGAVSLGGATRTLSIDSPVTVSGVVSSGNLVKTGGGTLALTANGNTHGTTTISSGTLQVGAGGTTGSLGTGAVTNDSALVFARSNSGTFSNAISGTGTIRAASGTTALTGTSTFTGPVTIDAGARFGTDGAGLLDTGSYAGAITTEGTLVIGSSLNQTLSGTVSGGGSILKSGGGTLTLSAANTHSGGVSLAGGTISIADAAALGSGALSPTLAVSSTSTLAYTTAAAGSIGNAITLGNPGATARTFAVVKTASSSTTGTDLILSGAISGGGTAATLFLDTSVGGDNTTTFTLSGSNTFRATINLNRGALVVGAPENLGDPANLVRLDSNANGSLGNLRFTAPMTVANPIEIKSAAYPINTNANDVVLTGAVSGTSGLVKLGTGRLTLGGGGSYTTTTISAGTLAIGSGGTAGTLGTGAVTNNAALVFNRSDDYGGPVSNAIGGTGAVTVAGGTLTLTGANTYQGTTTIAAGGTVQVGNAGTTGSLGTGGVTNDGTLTFARTNSITVSNTIGGAGGLRVTSGTVVLTANNTYAGTTTLTGGVLRIGNGGTAGSLGSGGAVTNAGLLAFNRSDDYGGPVMNVIGGTGGVTVLSGSLALTGANTYTGNTTVAAGATLVLGTAAALQNSTLVASSTGGAVAFTAPGPATYTIGGLSGDRAFAAAGTTLAIGGNGASTTYSGALTAAALVKDGAGVLTLTGSNTIGATTIAGGAIFAGSNNALGAGAVTLAGGLLQVGRGVTLANEIILSGGAGDVRFAGGLQIDYLLVGGGGGGAARDSGGGGGGGGVEAGVTGVVAGGTYAVTVGAGGAGADFGGGDGGTTVGGSGSSTSFAGITALGGGGGGGYGMSGASGASGGGGGRIGVGGVGIPGEGFNGGNGSGSTNNDGGGGGGGAGAVGGTAVTSVAAGSGGMGMASDITGTTTYYGGGGGGAGHRGTAGVASGTGGLGGGGNGSPRFGFAGNGTDGLGGGGGAARSDVTTGTSSRVGGNGGSGTVIVRYLGAPAAVGGVISSGTGSAAGYTLHTFTGVGSSSLTVDPVNAVIAGAILGSGGFTWDSPGILELTGSNSYAGETVIATGTLLVNGDQAAATGAVAISALAALGGSGTIGGATVIAGRHMPGNSPGLQTFTGGLTYASESAQLVWDLYANTVLDRGTNYDGVNVTGGQLTIDPAATLRLDFGTVSLGSTVDWDNAFWSTNRQWTVIDVSGGTTWNGDLFGTLVVGNDVLGRSLTSVRSDASFSVAASGGDVVLTYAVVPEPGAAALAGVGVVAAATWWAARRRVSRRRRPSDDPRRTGMTLVELLVVMAIIALLVALLFPAVQSVRESARRAQCFNNLKQLASAALQHEHANGFYPSGGWGCYWGGDPDSGFGPQQPGGWIYSTLPYTEQTPLWSLGTGQSAAEKKTATRRVFETPLPLLNCPSRRPSQTYPCLGSFAGYNCDPIPRAAKTDYGASLGGSTSSQNLSYYDGPQDGTDVRGPIPTPAANPWASHSGNSAFNAADVDMQRTRTGVIYLMSRVTPDGVIDGASSTYLLGEKYLPANHYTTGGVTRDNRGMYQGEDLDNSCWSVHSPNPDLVQPRQDTAGFDSNFLFGSTHAGTFGMAFCDGSIRWISYDISAATHAAQGNRRDRTPTGAAE